MSQTRPSPPPSPASRLSRALGIFRWWPNVNRGTLRADLTAGLTGAVVVLPQGVAFATIAGLPPQYGLYSAMVPAVIAALFGSSWHLVSGPTTAISIVVYSVIRPLADPGTPHYIELVLTLTFMVGVIQLVMGLARMGTLVNFISHTVVIGFTAGAAILIATKQVRDFFGIVVPRGSTFYQTVVALVKQLDSLNPYVTSVAVVTLATGLLLKRYYPKFPPMIAAMLVGSVVGLVLNRLFGAETTHINTVGALPRSLPPLSYPVLTAETIRQVGGSALAITMLGLTEAVSIARAIAVRSDQRIDGNREFIGQGLANIFGSFFSSYASSGSFNRSGLNYESGAKTPLAAVFASVVLGAILLLVAPLAAYLPVAAMAGILFLVAWGLIDFHHIKGIFRASRAEAGILTSTFLSTLFLELEFAIYVGVILSLMHYLSRTSRPLVLSLVPDLSNPDGGLAASQGRAECPQLKILEIHGSLFFGAIDHVQQRLQEEDAGPAPKHVLLIAESINFADIAGAEMLAREARRRRKLGGGLYLARVKERTLAMLRAGGFIDDIGPENIFETETQAIEAITRRLEPSSCGVCRHRVFASCPPANDAQEVDHAASPSLEDAMVAAAFAEEGEVDQARHLLGRAPEPKPSDTKR